MKKIIMVNADTVSIGLEDNSIKTVPMASVNYPNPQVGDEVQIFETGDAVIVSKAEPAEVTGPNATSNNGGQTIQVTQVTNNAPAGPTYAPRTNKLNKHVFVWVGTFLFGCLGVDRFMRGQVGLGILKILLLGGCFGIWTTIDWIIAMVKCYGSAFGSDQDVVFLNGKYAR